MNKWKQAQEWERSWWGNCQNTLAEQLKELVYVEKMGLHFSLDRRKGTPYEIDMEGVSVLDVGGGPISILLMCKNVKGKIIEPLEYPSWVYERYKTANLKYEVIKAEDMKEEDWDEVWIYNVLQHVEDPRKVIENSKKAGDLIRIFEWIDIMPSSGHIHTLTEKKLNEWLEGEGKTEIFHGENGLGGKAYYGIFPTRKKL